MNKVFILKKRDIDSYEYGSYEDGISVFSDGVVIAIFIS